MKIIKLYSIILVLLVIFFQGFSQNKPTITQGENKNDMLELHQILFFFINNELKATSLLRKNFTNSFAFKLKLNDSLKIIDYTYNIVTPGAIGEKLKFAFIKGIDSANKSKIDLSELKNKNLIIPLLIYYKPQKRDTLIESVPAYQIENMFNFKGSDKSDSRFWNQPIECVIFRPINYVFPNRISPSSKFEKYYKKNNQ